MNTPPHSQSKEQTSSENQYNSQNELNKYRVGQRKIWIDCLKSVAIFAMILQHVSASIYLDKDTLSTEWFIGASINGFTRFCVPIFIMISGSLFLSKKRPMKKYIVRIFMAIVFWLIFYGVFFRSREIIVLHSFSWNYFLASLCNPGHLWFLYMIAGLYIATPLIHEIVKTKKLCEYFLLIWLVSAVILPFCQDIPLFSTFVISIVYNAHLGIAIEYTGYYVLGYYLSEYNIGKMAKYSTLIIALGILSTLIGFLLYPKQDETGLFIFYKNLYPTTLLVSVGLFLWFKEHNAELTDKIGFNKFITYISVSSLGIYAIHKLFEILYTTSGIAKDINIALGILLGTVAVFGASCITVYLLKKFIPYTSKVL